MTLYYVDTSAALKLLVEGTDSKALAAFYDAESEADWISSTLLRIELSRAVARSMPTLLPDARDLQRAFSYIVMDDDIVEVAANEPDRMLRSLDAVHLATARALGTELDAIITYDSRLTTAAADAGLTAIAPRD